MDSVVLLPIHDGAVDALVEQGNTEANRIQNLLVEPLVYMMSRGMRMNADGMKEASTEIDSELLALTLQINNQSDNIIGNPNSPKQIMEYFYVHRGVKPYLSRTTHKVSVDEMALKRLAKPTSTRPGFKVASLILRHRGLAKLKGTYLDVELDSELVQVCRSVVLELRNRHLLVADPVARHRERFKKRLDRSPNCVSPPDAEERGKRQECHLGLRNGAGKPVEHFGGHDLWSLLS